GQTWETVEVPIGAGLTDSTVRRSALRFAPPSDTSEVASTLFLLTPSALLRSLDLGGRWDVAVTFTRADTPNLLATSSDFGRNGVAFLLADTRLRRSTDGGRTWDEISNALPSSPLTIALTEGGALFVVTSGDESGPLGLWTSNDFGQSF